MAGCDLKLCLTHKLVQISWQETEDQPGILHYSCKDFKASNSGECTCSIGKQPNLQLFSSPWENKQSFPWKVNITLNITDDKVVPKRVISIYITLSSCISSYPRMSEFSIKKRGEYPSVVTSAEAGLAPGGWVPVFCSAEHKCSLALLPDIPWPLPQRRGCKNKPNLVG